MRKVLICFLSIFILLTVSVPASVKADVLWEPRNNFFEENGVEYFVENRTYVVNSTNGFINVYNSPDSSITNEYLVNGETFQVYYKGTYKDKVWGMNTSEKYILLDSVYPEYDNICFQIDYNDQLTSLSEPKEFEVKKDYVLWDYPGAKYSDIKVSFNDPYKIDYSITFEDEEGLNWIYVGYMMGYRNFWICIDDPTNTELKIRDVNTPTLYPVVEPTREQIRNAAAEDVGKNVIGSQKGISIVVACICTITVIFIAAYLLTRKNHLEDAE